MVLCVRAVQSLILIYCLWMSEARQHSSVITVPNGGSWGTWGDVVLCPQGYADGFSIKVQEYQGVFLWQDDTSLNSIRLHCSNGSTIESKAGPQGTWSDTVKCPKGYMVSFALQVVESQGIGDDVGANNIQFTCEDGATVATKSHDWGTYGPWSQRCSEGYICGLQTKVEDWGAQLDKTALNDVKMYCCK